MSATMNTRTMSSAGPPSSTSVLREMVSILNRRSAGMLVITSSMVRRMGRENCCIHPDYCNIPDYVDYVAALKENVSIRSITIRINDDEILLSGGNNNDRNDDDAAVHLERASWGALGELRKLRNVETLNLCVVSRRDDVLRFGLSLGSSIVRCLDKKIRNFSLFVSAPSSSSRHRRGQPRGNVVDQEQRGSIALPGREVVSTGGGDYQATVQELKKSLEGLPFLEEVRIRVAPPPSPSVPDEELDFIRVDPLHLLENLELNLLTFMGCLFDADDADRLSRLKTRTMSFIDITSEGMSQDVAARLVRALSANERVKELRLFLGGVIIDHSSDADLDDLLEALRCNYHLEGLSVPHSSPEQRRQINTILHLNKAGRSYLIDGDHGGTITTTTTRTTATRTTAGDGGARWCIAEAASNLFVNLKEFAKDDLEELDCVFYHLGENPALCQLMTRSSV